MLHMPSPAQFDQTVIEQAGSRFKSLAKTPALLVQTLTAKLVGPPLLDVVTVALAVGGKIGDDDAHFIIARVDAAVILARCHVAVCCRQRSAIAEWTWILM